MNTARSVGHSSHSCDVGTGGGVPGRGGGSTIDIVDTSNVIIGHSSSGRCHSESTVTSIVCAAGSGARNKSVEYSDIGITGGIGSCAGKITETVITGSAGLLTGVGSGGGDGGSRSGSLVSAVLNAVRPSLSDNITEVIRVSGIEASNIGCT